MGHLLGDVGREEGGGRGFCDKELPTADRRETRSMSRSVFQNLFAPPLAGCQHPRAKSTIAVGRGGICTQPARSGRRLRVSLTEEERNHLPDNICCEKELIGGRQVCASCSSCRLTAPDRPVGSNKISWRLYLNRSDCCNRMIHLIDRAETLLMYLPRTGDWA